jgi:ATP-dependent helicase HepA
VVAWLDSTDTPELLLEAIYLLECPLALDLQVEALLPPTPLRVVVDADFSEAGERYPHPWINRHTAVLDDGAVRALLSHHREMVEALLEVAEINAQIQQHDLLDACHRRAETLLRAELAVLEARHRLNPAVHAGELAAARQRLQRLDEILPTASLRLDALRLVVGQG